MSAEIRIVKLEKIRPNPFRDIDNYPFWRDKLDRLKESIKSTGQWPNIIVREDPEQAHYYQLAYGHHRLQALKELHFVSMDVVVQDLSDDVMLKMMCDENAEEFGTNFMLGTMNAVSAVKKRLEHVNGHMISANDVGRFLGWTSKDSTSKDGLQASQRVWIAFRALELIEKGVCKPQAFQGLGHEQAAQVVRQAELVYKARIRELEKDASEKEVKAAERKAAAEAKAVAAKVIGAIKDGKGIRELKQETKALTVATQRQKPASEVDVSVRMERAAHGLSHWLEQHKDTLALWGAGAICDKQVVKQLRSAFNAVEKELKKAEEKRG